MTSTQAIRPLIGLTGRRKTLKQLSGFPDSLGHLEADLYLNVYSKAILNAGGLPVHIPLDANPADYLSRLDGVLLSGGADVDPGRYGHENTNSDTEPFRDDVEFALLEQTVACGLPVLGICRGHQVLNVYAGGTLDQDEPPHARYDVDPSTEVHQLRFAPGSRLEALYDGSASVNSLHHQTVARVGDGLTVSAWAEDGTIEGLELDGHDVLSVQWHPEMLTKTEPVFAWLVDKASAIAAARN